MIQNLSPGKQFSPEARDPVFKSLFSFLNLYEIDAGLKVRFGWCWGSRIEGPIQKFLPLMHEIQDWFFSWRNWVQIFTPETKDSGLKNRLGNKGSVFQDRIQEMLFLKQISMVKGTVQNIFSMEATDAGFQAPVKDLVFTWS